MFEDAWDDDLDVLACDLVAYWVAWVLSDGFDGGLFFALDLVVQPDLVWDRVSEWGEAR